MSSYTTLARSLLLPLASVALLAVIFHPPLSAQSAGQGLVAGGQRPDLILLCTGDVIGYLDPCG